MSKILHDIEVPLNEELKDHLAWMVPNYADFRILRQSVDARRKHQVHQVFSVEVAEAGETLPVYEETIQELPKKNRQPVLIIGTGPAGLFAALRLIERGIPCILFERGSVAEKRMMGINRFWRYGELDTRNNVCFGEGGAGLYSDGKLITRIKSPYIPYVLNRLVKFGAPAEIQYLANPHVGSDRLRRVIPFLRQELLRRGAIIHFDTRVSELLFEGKQIRGLRTEHGDEFLGQQVILATGHSAKDIFEQLRDQGVALQGKSFAMGLRVEHPQSLINRIQYREFADHPKLGAANYKLTHHDHPTNTGVYSFCMCPGGYILSSGTEPNALVCNGMSNYRRNSPFANAAVVVTVDHDKIFGKDMWGGFRLRSDLERKAFESVRLAGGTKQLPAQKMLDFMQGRATTHLGAYSTPSGAVPIRLDQLLPSWMTEALRQGLKGFQNNMRDYVHESAQLFGVETRTSCPLRVPRHNDSLQSISHAGLYPCGEGAGYAGGITSAACDGIRVAEAIVQELR